MKAAASSDDDPLPLSEPLAKRGAKIDPASLRVGMLIEGHDGKPAKITKIDGVTVVFEFDGGSGTTLADHVQAVA